MATRSYASVSVEGMSNLLHALDAMGYGSKDLRKAMGAGSRELRNSLRKEAPKLSGSLASTARPSAGKNSAAAQIGKGDAVPYARWQALSKKSPNRYYHNRALYGSRNKVVHIVANDLQSLINRVGL